MFATVFTYVSFGILFAFAAAYFGGIQHNLTGFRVGFIVFCSFLGGVLGLLLVYLSFPDVDIVAQCTKCGLNFFCYLFGLTLSLVCFKYGMLDF